MPFDRGNTERVERPQRTSGSGQFPRPAASGGYEALERCSSAAMLRVRRLVQQSAANDLSVLITGEVGVRKDLVAREIHRRSARADQRLCEINCRAVLDNALSRGVLPDWLAGASGDAARAAGATLFLNGVGELPPRLQEELLELLRLSDGANEQRPPALRVIASTQRDLAAAVDAGTFNEELYYRLNVIHIHVPPLRAHLEDLPLLIDHFLREHGRQLGRPIDILPEAIRARMQTHPWHGNLRELDNAIRSYVALRDPAYVLEELDARSDRRSTNGSSSSHPPPSAMHVGASYRVDLKRIGREAADAAEKDAIIEMLAQTRGHKKLAAHRLGISYKALLYKIRDFGIATDLTSDEHPHDIEVEARTSAANDLSERIFRM